MTTSTTTTSTTATEAASRAAGRDRPKRPRLSRAVLRTWAWIGAALSFFAPLAAIAAGSEDASVGGSEDGDRPVIVHRVLRRIVVHEAPTNLPPPSSVTVAQPPAGPPAVTSTGGS